MRLTRSLPLVRELLLTTREPLIYHHPHPAGAKKGMEGAARLLQRHQGAKGADNT